MKKICIITSTRADFGLLLPVIFKLQECINVEVVGTGTHLLHKFGFTINEVKSHGIKNLKQVEIMNENFSGSKEDIFIVSQKIIIKFSDLFLKNHYDAVLVLGDRYEIMNISYCAFLTKTPIIHLYGGEKTLGAQDDIFRHMISKMSSLHFVSTQEYRNRVIQLGENPHTVIVSGSTGVENTLKLPILTKESLELDLPFIKNKKYCVATFHPETNTDVSSIEQLKILLEVLCEFYDLAFIFTKANADEGGVEINQLISNYVSKYNNIYLVDSLGSTKYFSAIRHSEFVIGNSSSGIIEVPSLGKYTINVGDRQKGRAQGNSIINCEISSEEIKKAIIKVLSDKEKEVFFNPYFKENSSNIISEEIIKRFNNDEIKSSKEFFDIKILIEEE